MALHANWLSGLTYRTYTGRHNVARYTAEDECRTKYLQCVTDKNS